MLSIYLLSSLLLQWNWDNRMIAPATNGVNMKYMDKVSQNLATINHNKA